MKKHTKAQIAAMAALFYDGLMELDENGDYESGWPNEPVVTKTMAKWLVDNKFAYYRRRCIKSTKLLEDTYPYAGHYTGKEDYKASPAEITKACNSTYGMGLNPEAAYSILTSLRDCVSLIEQGKSLSGKHHKRVLRDALAAIQKAKL